MELTIDQRTELQALVKSTDVSATVATRARIVLWWAEGYLKKQVAELAGVSRPTVDLWLNRYETEGLAGLFDRSHAAPREQVPARIRGPDFGGDSHESAGGDRAIALVKPGNGGIH